MTEKTNLVKVETERGVLGLFVSDEAVRRLVDEALTPALPRYRGRVVLKANGPGFGGTPDFFIPRDASRAELLEIAAKALGRLLPE